MPAPFSGIADSAYTIGFHPHHLSLDGSRPGAVPVRARVLVTEITGSESFVHLDFAGVGWVMLTHGIKDFRTDDTIEVFIDSRHLMVFDEHGRSAARRVEMAA